MKRLGLCISRVPAFTNLPDEIALWRNVLLRFRFQTTARCEHGEVLGLQKKRTNSLVSSFRSPINYSPTFSWIASSQSKSGLSSVPRLPARLANETGLDIGQPHIIRPPRTGVGTEPGPVRALEIGAIEQQPAHAGGAHLAQGYLLRPAHVGNQMRCAYRAGERRRGARPGPGGKANRLAV
jgi:hypothetical protein